MGILVAALVLAGCGSHASVSSPPSAPRQGPAAAKAPAGPSAASLGINLAGLSDWSTEIPFVDVFRLSREWISQREGAGWGQGPKLQLDEHGWVRRLEPGTWAETPLNTIEGGHYPSGTYTVLYDGKGELAFTNAQVKSATPGKMLVDVDSRRGGFFLQIRRTDPADHVRNVRVYLPGHGPASAPGGFNPSLLARWRGVSTVRFMDWMATNNSKQERWADRPKPTDANWATKGAPVEVMVDLANRLGTDPWFTLPHRVDDDYVRRFAQVVKERLDPKRKVYVEYSNELWNSMFEQSRYAGEQGTKLKLGEKPWEAGWRYTAQRSVEIFRIWESVFGGRSRLVRLLPGFAANDWVSNEIVSWKDAAKHADALAIAPYIPFNIGPDSKPPVSEVAGWNLDRLFQELRDKALPESVGFIQKHAAVAKKHNLRLIAYEGGQHLVGVAGGENNDQMTSLFLRANADPRMGALHDDYFRAWVQSGGAEFAYFSSVGGWSKWGSWGVLQYVDEDPAKSPKWQALKRFAASRGQKLGQ
jgi:hypothetical protein